MTSGTDLPAATKLAIERTRLAHERTMMAWVRTATSLISFGFTIHKFFQYLYQSQNRQAPLGMVGPRGFGLLMITIGLTALVFATLEQRRSMQFLRKEYDLPEPVSLAAVVASLVAILGVVGFMMVLFRG